MGKSGYLSGQLALVRRIGLLLYSCAYVSGGILIGVLVSDGNAMAIVLRLSLVQSLQLIESEMPIRDPIVCTIKVRGVLSQCRDELGGKV